MPHCLFNRSFELCGEILSLIDSCYKPKHFFFLLPATVLLIQEMLFFVKERI